MWRGSLTKKENVGGGDSLQLPGALALVSGALTLRAQSGTCMCISSEQQSPVTPWWERGGPVEPSPQPNRVEEPW